MTLRLAIPKGRLLQEALRRLGQSGVPVEEVAQHPRRLIHPLRTPHPELPDFELIVLRGHDVPLYVERGAAHIGIAGFDVLMELEADVYIPHDLGIGRCRMVIAGYPDLNLPSIRSFASKFPRIARKYVEQSGTPAEVFALKGAVETAPMVGLADAIIDIVETGETLRKNGLVEHKTLFEVSTRIIQNRAATQLHANAVEALTGLLL